MKRTYTFPLKIRLQKVNRSISHVVGANEFLATVMSPWHWFTDWAFM